MSGPMASTTSARQPASGPGGYMRAGVRPRSAGYGGAYAGGYGGAYGGAVYGGAAYGGRVYAPGYTAGYGYIR
jgi:hypothetical protein